MTKAISVATAVGNGPAFSAYASAGTAILTSTFTKIAMAVEEYDTNSNYDTALSRFTPTVAGYYKVSGRIAFTANLTSTFVTIYKNGTENKRGSGGVMNSPIVAALIYMNGTTDYVELYGYQSAGGSQTTGTIAAENYFQASLVRGA